MSNLEMLEINQEISKILENSPAERHSYFQLRYFLIGKEPTNQGKMWQCLRELKVRKESLESLNLEYEDQKDQLELLEIEESLLNLSQNNTEKNEKDEIIKKLRTKENNIKLRKIKRQKTAIISSLSGLLTKKRYIEEESRFFLELFKSLEKNEPLRDLDDIEAQKEYWSEKLSQKLNLKMLLGGQLDTELVETVVALPDDIQLKKQILNTLNIRYSQIVKNLEQNKEKPE
jgi:hypothetical protein